MKSARVSIGAVLVLGLAVVSAPTAATAKTVTVNPGDSIQAAVDAASPNDTIKVMPGDYMETTPGPAAITINKSKLTLIAMSKLTAVPAVKVRILPNHAIPGQIHGILVQPAHDGDPDITNLTIQGFTVEGFNNMGIWLRHVNNFKILGNESINNQENGIFPTLSANGLVKQNVAYGSLDSALWVEGSQKVRVLKNQLSKSPTGLEITISNDITVQQNNIHDNTIGVGLYNPASAGLPQNEWPAGPYGFWHIVNNHVHHNNLPNPVSGASEVSALPSGGGILLLGVQNVDVQKNQIERNDFFGIGVVDYCLATAPNPPFDCTDSPPPAPPLGSPTAPDSDQIFNNTLVDNHAFPPAGIFQPLAADILELQLDATTAGLSDCFSNNKITNENGLSGPLTMIPDGRPACP